VQLYTSASDCKHVGNIPVNHFVKAFSALNDVSTKKHRPFNADFSLGNRQKSDGARSAKYRGCSSVVILFSDTKSLTKTDRCAGALLWRRSQLLVLHFSAHFLLTASLRHQWMSVYIYLFTAAIPVNFTSEFPKLFEATMYFIKLLSGTTQNNCLNSGWWHHKIIPQALYFLTIEWLGKQSSTSVTVQWHTFCPAPQNTHR